MNILDILDIEYQGDNCWGYRLPQTATDCHRLPQNPTDCHRLSLTGLNASVYSGLNAQSYKWDWIFERKERVGIKLDASALLSNIFHFCIIVLMIMIMMIIIVLIFLIIIAIIIMIKVPKCGSLILSPISEDCLPVDSKCSLRATGMLSRFSIIFPIIRSPSRQIHK